MALDRPVFVLDTPNPNPANITDAAWWLWLRLHELEPRSEFSGILAWKKGFHSTGKYNSENFPDNYSIRDTVNRTGPWWWSKASALDWTFKDAQAGNYVTIDKYTSRLMASARDVNDRRLDLILFEFYGQADSDSQVEGYNEYREEFASSDSSHLWHIHMSFLRSQCGSFWGMWALLTVLMGWTVAQWQASLPADMQQPTVPVDNWTERLVNNLPTVKRGSDLHMMVKRIQSLVNIYNVAPRLNEDGIYGLATESAVKAFQRMRVIPVDGVVGKGTWAKLMGV